MKSLNNFPQSFFREPVDHVLIRSGLCSDRTFMTYIKKHEVQVNVTSVHDRKILVDVDSDEIFIDGKKLVSPEHLYVILNKPVNVVCSKVSDSHKTVFDFLPESIKQHPFYKYLHIAGRLDADSRGLVLLTSNGKFSSSLLQPETHVEKTYEVCLKNEVNAEIREQYIKAFSEGFDLPPEKKGEGFKTLPAELKFFSKENDRGDRPLCFCKVTLQEGKFRQIRRMFQVLGNEVTDLKRVSIGAIKLPSELLEGNMMQLSRNSGLLN